MTDGAFVLPSSLIDIGSVLTEAALFHSRNGELAILRNIGELAFARLIDIRLTVIARLNNRGGVSGTAIRTRLGDVGHIAVAALIDVGVVGAGLSIDHLNDSRGIISNAAGRLIYGCDAATTCAALANSAFVVFSGLIDIG